MWIEWEGDERDFSCGAMQAWPCGCAATVEWQRKKATHFCFEVATRAGPVIRGAVVGMMDRDAGMALAARMAEALHQEWHREE